jgi:hypothetical protein
VALDAASEAAGVGFDHGYRAVNCCRIFTWRFLADEVAEAGANPFAPGFGRGEHVFGVHGRML